MAAERIVQYSERSCIPSKKHLVLLGDFNTRLGADHDSRYSGLAQFRVGKMSDNGQRLLELYMYHNEPKLRTSFSHVLPTAVTEIQTTPWCSAISSFCPRDSVRSGGILALMQARYASQILCKKFGSRFDKERATHGPETATEK